MTGVVAVYYFWSRFSVLHPGALHTREVCRKSCASSMMVLFVKTALLSNLHIYKACDRAECHRFQNCSDYTTKCKIRNLIVLHNITFPKQVSLRIVSNYSLLAINTIIVFYLQRPGTMKGSYA